MEMDPTLKRMHSLFAGRVQGVGFRISICRIAERFPVTGFVRNLDNGEVELVAEGKEEILSAFAAEIRNSSLKRHLLHERIQWETASGEFNKFGIYYS
jgi:acylphosphatase